MKKMINQRKKLRKFCSVLVDGKEGSPFEACRTVDISEGGAGFVSSRYIPLNTKMMLQIELTPEGDPILATGVVKWVQKITGTDNFRIGLQFEKFVAGSKSGLRRYKTAVV